MPRTKRSKEKRQRRSRRGGCTLTIEIKNMFPFDRVTEMELDAETLDQQFKERLCDAVGDVLSKDPQVGFDQDMFDFQIKIR